MTYSAKPRQPALYYLVSDEDVAHELPQPVLACAPVGLQPHLLLQGCQGSGPLLVLALEDALLKAGLLLLQLGQSLLVERRLETVEGGRGSVPSKRHLRPLSQLPLKVDHPENKEGQLFTDTIMIGSDMSGCFALQLNISIP